MELAVEVAFPVGIFDTSAHWNSLKDIYIECKADGSGIRIGNSAYFFLTNLSLT